MNTFHFLNDRKFSDLSDRFFVLDIETWGFKATPKSFAFCCLYGANTKKVFYSVEDVKKELRNVRYKNKIIFAHNAEFDLTGIYGNIIKFLDDEAIFNNKFIMCRNKHITYNKQCSIVFADSFNIIPFSAKRIGEGLGFKKFETPQKFIKGIRGKITTTDVKYCFRDCEIIFKALTEIFNESQAFKITIGGISLDYFRRKYMNKSFFVDDILQKYFYESYFGGRVECFKIGNTISHKYDVNSMYPFVMSEMSFPDTSNFKKKKIKIDESNFYLNKYEGLISCSVEHKKNNFGYLPYRFDNGKVVFPIGKFSGTWNFNEIRFALSRGMIKITKINFILYSKRIKTPFKDFVFDLYKKRQENSGTFKEHIYKLIMNNLYGKFGSKEKTKTIYFKDSKDLSEKIKKYPNALIKNFSMNRKDGYLVLTSFVKSKFSIPSFASYITAEARILLLEYFEKMKDHTITYCDTDCICVEKKLNQKNSNVLGELKLEKTKITKILGNKFYFEIDDNQKTSLKLKGVTKNAKQSKKGFVFSKDKILKTKESLRRGLESGISVSSVKTISTNYDKRFVSVNENQFTSPVSLNE